jgi:aromatic amino acid transport protein AroP
MSTEPPHLKRALKNRHIQLIALGGAIGTGLFLGSAGVMQMAGPAMLLGYAIGGLIAFLIMRQLGEMVVSDPVAGSFSHFAYEYWNPFAGFFSGWNYWVLYVLVSMSELTAVAKYIHYWWPEMPQWIPVLAFFLIINAINLANVKLFGEMEFWFAIIKVLAVIGMIAFGIWLLVSGNGGENASVSNLWDHGGFFPGELWPFLVSLVIIMFSFGGIELVGIAAAEASDPEKTIPKAINQILYRILIFYIGAIGVMLMLVPWNEMAAIIKAGGDNYSGSPFVLIFSKLGISNAAHILNFVILTAALSVFNSGVYCNSRMLYGLAQQGNAPKALLKIDRRGVPVAAIAMSALATGIGVIINYAIPKQALEILMSLVVASLVLNWMLISYTHLQFRRKKQQEPNYQSLFPAWGAPYTNYLTLAFVGFILVVMAATQEMRISVMLIPPWFLVLWIGWKIKQKRQRSLQ